MRFLALHLPTFAVDLIRLRARASGPPSPQPGGHPVRDALTLLLLTDVKGGSKSIMQCSPEATHCGVRRGMSLAHARALLGDHEHVVERFDAEANQNALEELAAWALRFSPHVCVDPPDRLLLDVSGSERLFGGEERLLECAVESFGVRGFHVNACIANTIGCALAIACFGCRSSSPAGRNFTHDPGEGRYRSVPAGGEPEALAPLTTRALRLDPQVVDALAEIGVERIAQLYELPRDSLPARFGNDLLMRLDQALGRAFETFTPQRPRFLPQAARSFESPVGLEVVAYSLRQLLRELIGVLESHGASAQSIEFELLCAESTPVLQQIALSRAHTDFEHLWSLIAPLLESAQLGFGVERVTLSMPRTVQAEAVQVAAWDSERSSTDSDRLLGELLDTLASRLGREGVLRIQAVESYLPEQAFRTLPCSQTWDQPQQQRAKQARITHLPRPSRLFMPPEAVEAESRLAVGLASGPSWFRRRGEIHRIVRRFGPERIGVPWWTGSSPTAVRDYFCVEDECGRWFWLVLNLSGNWFLHGEWI